MTDHLRRTARAALMASVRTSNTAPEQSAQSLLRQHGIRFRTHDKSLPGTPDIVLPAQRLVIFVHGCFWHQHKPCRQYRMPKSRTEFWLPKLMANKRRDMRTQKLLSKMGWRVLVLWECELRNSESLISRIQEFMTKQ